MRGLGALARLAGALPGRGHRLYLGDNLEVMRHLARKGVRVELAYLDPPFNTGTDFFFRPRRGREEFAYRDRWPSLKAWLAGLRPRVAAARELLTTDGCLHLDPQTSHYAKVMLDELFGPACYANEIVWRYRRWPTPSRHFQRMHDVLLRYVRDSRARPRWTQLYDPLSASTIAGKGGLRQTKRWSAASGKTVGMALTTEASPGALMADVWELPLLAHNAAESTGYPTQKPEALLERVISACTYPGDTVLDPYSGSGTTLAVAMRLGRRALGIDASRVAVRVASTRLD